MVPFWPSFPKNLEVVETFDNFIQAACLIMANKQDLPDAMSTKEARIGKAKKSM